MAVQPWSIDVVALLAAGLGGWVLAPVVERMAGRRCPRWALVLSALLAGASLLCTRQGWDIALGLALALTLLAAAAVDVLAYRLPNVLTLPLAAAGVALACLRGTGVLDALVGAGAGFLVLWFVDLVYRRLRGRSGMGLGDAKLFGAAGAWLGWQALPPVLLFTCAGGLAWAAMRLLRGWGKRSDALPLGPWLALAFWALWIMQGAAAA